MTDTRVFNIEILTMNGLWQNERKQPMKIIFLDVDGVLNSNKTEDVFRGFIGLDYSCIRLLKEIVDATSAEIVLVSRWKSRW